MKTENLTISTNEKISLISNLSTMLSAGIPILETIDSLLEDAKGNLKKVLEEVRADLIQGKHLHSSFIKFPLIFDKVTVSIIKAAEEGGNLEITLKDLKVNLKKEVEFNDKVTSALIYPVIIMIVFCGVLLLMLTFVIPKISTVFERLRVDLPLPTKVLIFVSKIMLNFTVPFIIFVLFTVLILSFIYKTKRKFLVFVLTSLPIVSGLAREIDLTRFSRSLYLLLSSGITITHALDLTQDVVMKKEVAKAIANCKEVVLGGKPLSEGFKNARKIFPAIMIKITEAGEKSGTLDRSMQDISEFLDYQVSNTLRIALAVLEPVMLVVVGILIGGMMLAIIAPIYGLIGQVGAR